MSYFGQWFGEYDGDWWGGEDDEDQGFGCLVILRRDYAKEDDEAHKRRNLRAVFEQAFREPEAPAAAAIIKAVAPALPEAARPLIASREPVPLPRIDWTVLTANMADIHAMATRFADEQEEEDDMFALLLAA